MPQRSRRYLFLTLLLISLAAPAGWVFAGQMTEPYVVLFRDDVVGVPDDVMTAGAVAQSFLSVNQPESAPAAVPRADGHRRIDSRRVESHVRELAASTRIGEIDNLYTSAVGGFSARLTTAQIAAISADPAVSAVLPDEPVSLGDLTAADAAGGLHMTANPTERVQPGVRRIGARSAALMTLTGNGTREVNADVALIDTGVQRDHPDLNVVGGYNCTSRDHTKWDDTNGHGTHVAGIVGALDNRIGVTGVAPGVRLWSVKVLDRNGHGFLSWVVCGVDWVTAQRDKAVPSRPLIEVANMSLSFSGGDDGACGTINNDTLHQAICRSVNRGTVYTVAAGNESRNARRNRPASYDEVITVSAMADYDGRGGGRGRAADSCPYWSSEPDDAFASFSNYGPDVDLVAPGKCVLSTFMGSRYAWMSGTSMASPHVAGAAVLYRTMFPRATPLQVQMALEAVGTLDWRTSSDPDNDHEKAVWVGQFRMVPDFAIFVAPTGVVAPGDRISVGVQLTRVGGFSGSVSVSLDANSVGFSAQRLVTRGTVATLQVDVAPATKPGRYSLVVRAVSGDVVHTAVVVVTVGGTTPHVGFTSPPSGVTIQSGTDVHVAWIEKSGAAQITSRRLERQLGAIRAPGTCDGVSYSTEVTRNNATETTDHVRSGFCYRWILTLTDASGVRSTIQSGVVLVDATAPRAPTVQIAGNAAYAPDLNALGIDQAYIGHSGQVWVRAGVSGSVAVDVDAYDGESGVARNIANVTRNTGWRIAWVGDSADGALRLYYDTQGSTARLEIASQNGAGLIGPVSGGTLMRDASSPSAAVWQSAPADSTREIDGSYFKLDWTGATDVGAGLSDYQVVGRYRAGLNSDGTCKSNGFAADGGFHLVRNHGWESGLVPGACYVWSVRTLDNVGNISASVVSGYVITLADRKP